MSLLTASSFVIAMVFAVLVQLYKGGYNNAERSTKERKTCAVLVTGAGRGIGKTITAHLSLIGYTVFGTVRSKEAMEDLTKANESKVAEGKVIPIKMDVTNEEQIAAAVNICKAKCQELGLEFVGIINNAGINPEGDKYAKLFYEEKKVPENVLADAETVMKVLDTNVVGCFRVTKAFLPILSPINGRIVLIGSYFGTIAGGLGLSHLAYEASKFSIEALADGLRRGLKREGNIKVSLIKPGNIQTDMNEFAGETPPVVVSRDVLIALEAKRPSARYYPGMVKGLPCKYICDFFALLPSIVTDTQV